MAAFVSNFAHAVTDSVNKESIAQTLSRNLKTLGSQFDRTEAGSMLKEHLEQNYIPMFHQTHEAMVRANAALPTAQQVAPQILEGKARQAARVHALGKNDGTGILALAAIDKDPKLSPAQKLKEKQVLADTLHVFLKDTKIETSSKRGKIAGVEYSEFKKRAQQNKAYPQPQINAGAIYKPPKEGERKLMSATSCITLAGIAIPHLATALNIGLNTPLGSLAKGMLTLAQEHPSGVKQAFMDFGIFDATFTDAWTTRYYGSRGILAKSFNPGFGAAVAAVTHQPGFHPLRETQISLAATVAYHTLHDMTKELIQSGGRSARAIKQLKMMRIDPQEILATNGNLTPDLIKRGVFWGVDNKIFLDNSMSRSMMSGANFMHRMSLMFHGYITRQTQLMRNTLIHPTSLKELPMNLALLGVAFPTVGVMLKTLEMGARGQGQEATPVQDLENLYGANGPEAMAKEMLEGYMHVGAYGSGADYIRGGMAHKFANTLIGPVGNEASNLVEDTLSGTFGAKHDFKPLARDVVEDTLPLNIGKWLAHRALPNAREIKLRNPPRQRRHHTTTTRHGHRP